MRVRNSVVLAAGFLIVSLVSAQAPTSSKEEILIKPDEDRRDLTLLVRSTTNTNEFIHKAAKVSFVIPNGWKEIRPQRLYRKLNPRTSSVLGIELFIQREDRDVVASVYWLPIGVGEKLGDWIRTEAVDNEYGEEYETLKAIYGRENVTLPKLEAYGSFNVFKVSFKGGPRSADGGTLYVFEVSTTEGRWMLKVRVTYPLADKAANEKYAEDVIRSFNKITGDIPSAKDTKDTKETKEVPEKK